jgi:hypothetical protein
MKDGEVQSVILRPEGTINPSHRRRKNCIRHTGLALQNMLIALGSNILQ